MYVTAEAVAFRALFTDIYSKQKTNFPVTKTHLKIV